MKASEVNSAAYTRLCNECLVSISHHHVVVEGNIMYATCIHCCNSGMYMEVNTFS